MRTLIAVWLIITLVGGLYVNFTRESKVNTILSEYKKEYIAYMKEIGEVEEIKGEPLTWEELQQVGEEIAIKYDIPPAVLIAQMGLESGRGTSHYCQVRNNCFGLGAYDWNPDQAFDFPTKKDGIEFYARLISQNDRYSQAYAKRHDPYAMIRAIKAAGYATDPQYVSKITSMPEFQQYAN